MARIIDRVTELGRDDDLGPGKREGGEEGGEGGEGEREGDG